MPAIAIAVVVKSGSMLSTFNSRRLVLMLCRTEFLIALVLRARR